jgi:hypothetical protein
MALPVFRFKSSLQNNQIFDFAELYLAFGFWQEESCNK